MGAEWIAAGVLFVVVALVVMSRRSAPDSATDVYGLRRLPERDCHPEVPPEQDAEIARDALARGEIAHALHHVAGALGGDPNNDEWLDLLTKVLKNADDPLSLLPAPAEGKPLYFGVAAVRARVLRDAGRLNEALQLLFQVIVAKPDVAYLRWAESWLAAPGADKVAGDTFGWFLAEWAHRTDDPGQLARVLPIAETATKAHPEHPQLILLCCGILRRTGHTDRAVEVAKAALESHPTFGAAAALGTAYRARGEMDRAVEAFQRALKLAPDDMGVPLDLGDTLFVLGRLEEAIATYETVLRREPKHAWAHPSALYARGLASKDRALLEGARGELTALAKKGNARAEMLLAEHARLMSPWFGFLPDPSDVTAKAWEQILAAQPGKKELAGGRLVLSHLEAPSNSLVPAVLAARGITCKLTIEVQKIQVPDPRQPKGSVEYLLWHYDGTTPSPSVGPPPPDVAARIAELAATPYTMDAWWNAAAATAQELRPQRLNDLLAVMVHPPPPPDERMPFSWIQQVQVAAAFVVARLDDGWAGSVRRRVLDALARGPIDWSTIAAILALTKIAREHEPARAEVRALFLRLLQEAPRESGCCYGHPLVTCWATIPGVPAAERAQLEEMRAGLER